MREGEEKMWGGTDRLGHLRSDSVRRIDTEACGANRQCQCQCALAGRQTTHTHLHFSIKSAVQSALLMLINICYISISLPRLRALLSLWQSFLRQPLTISSRSSSSSSSSLTSSHMSLKVNIYTSLLAPRKERSKTRLILRTRAEHCCHMICFIGHCLPLSSPPHYRWQALERISPITHTRVFFFFIAPFSLKWTISEWLKVMNGTVGRCRCTSK